MPNQVFSLYTVDSYDGMLAYSSEENTIVSCSVEEKLKVGSPLIVGTKFGTVKQDLDGGNVFGIALRELNHEFQIDATGEDVFYQIGDVIPVLRQGTFYASVVGTLNITLGTKASCWNNFGVGSLGGGASTCNNITWEESGSPGDVVLARIDIIN